MRQLITAETICSQPHIGLMVKRWSGFEAIVDARPLVLQIWPQVVATEPPLKKPPFARLGWDLHREW